jgi:3-dehydroquinate synthetase
MGEVVGLLKQFDLPTRLPREIRRHEVLDAIGRDKKFQEGKIRFVVTPRLGSAHISSEVTMENIAESIAKL